MYFVLTTAGNAAISATPGVPPVLGNYKLGSGSNYTPTSGATALAGSVLYTGTLSAPIVEAANVIRYVITLDRTVGNFNFGEIGLYLPNGTLFALASSNTLIPKIQSAGPTVGNDITVDCYVTTSGTQYDIYSELSNSASPFSAPRVSSVDILPKPDGSGSNIYVVGSPTDDAGSMLATAYEGRWSIQDYSLEVAHGVVSSASGAVINFSSYTDSPAAEDLTITEPGTLLVQFISGPLSGVVRSITIISTSGPGVIHVSSAYSLSPNPGDLFIVYRRNRFVSATSFQPALQDTNGSSIPLNTQVMTKAQTLAAIASAAGTVTADSLTGLDTAMQSAVTGNVSFPRVVDVFGTALGRVFTA